MPTQILIFREWQFEFDRELTEKTYQNTPKGGADTCTCGNCKNFVATRDAAFPIEIRTLFDKLGIDFRKDAEISEIGSDEQFITWGWFHFKGRLLSGKNCMVPLPTGGHSVDFSKITDSFSIGFSEQTHRTYFEEKSGLVQVEFEVKIPWVFDKALENQ